MSSVNLVNVGFFSTTDRLLLVESDLLSLEVASDLESQLTDVIGRLPAFPFVVLPVSGLVPLLNLAAAFFLTAAVSVLTIALSAFGSW